MISFPLHVGSKRAARQQALKYAARAHRIFEAPECEENSSWCKRSIIGLLQSGEEKVLLVEDNAAFDSAADVPDFAISTGMLSNSDGVAGGPCYWMRLPLTVLTSQCAKEKRVIPTLQIWKAARSAFRRTAARHGRSRLARAAFGHGAGPSGRYPGKAIGNGDDYLFHLLGSGVTRCQDLHCCLSPSLVSWVGFCLFLSNWSDDRGPLRTRRYCKRASGSLQGALAGGSDRRRQDLEVVLATAKECARQRSEPIRRRVPSGMRT